MLATPRAISPERVVPFCPWFGTCGGCASQDVPLGVQLAWKRTLVSDALAREQIISDVAPCRDAHGLGRRRATFHARTMADGRMRVGFMAARSHDLVAIDQCPLFVPELGGALDAARAVAPIFGSLGKPLDIAVTATLTGLDMDVRGSGPLDERLQAKLITIAGSEGLARLSNHGRPLVTFRTPQVAIGAARVNLPPGAFLQATQAGEDTLSSLVLEATAGARRVADLFSGIGTFALRLASQAEVTAAESSETALDALLVASRETAGLHAVSGNARDLVRRPLTTLELNAFDAIVFDPPRAGAPEQVAEIAHSQVPLVIGVSCNPQTFARDAKFLLAGGYTLARVTPVDQFRHSLHVELVGVFRRAKVRKKRSLLG